MPVDERIAAIISPIIHCIRFMDMFFYYFKIGQKTDFEIALTEKLEKHWVFFYG